MISASRAFDIIRMQNRCVMRSDKNKCGKYCEVCELALPTNDIIEAYEYALSLIKKEMYKK